LLNCLTLLRMASVFRYPQPVNVAKLSSLGHSRWDAMRVLHFDRNARFINSTLQAIFAKSLLAANPMEQVM
jgi:hypothetical protein